MKSIHRHIFQDVYEWAGQERVGPMGKMTKDGPDVVNFAVGDPDAPTVAYGYYPAGAIADAAHAQYHMLADENHLVGLGLDAFVGRLAEHWGEINTIHAFREGNTRSQFVFFSQLADNAGYTLESEAFKVGSPLRDEFVAARFYNQATTKTDPLAELLAKVTRPVGASRESAAPDARPLVEQRLRERFSEYPELRGITLDGYLQRIQGTRRPQSPQDTNTDDPELG